jgi:hypothetical protein
MNPVLPRLTALLLALTVAACGGNTADEAPTTDDPQVLARYDGGELRVENLDAFLLTQPAAQRRPAAGEEFGPWIHRRLDDLFVVTVLSTPDSVAAAQADPAFESAWQSRRRTALARRYLSDLAIEVEVSPEEVESYFNQHRKELAAPERRMVRNLLLSFPDGATDADKEALCARAEELRLQALGGASFADLATQYSDSATAALGGMVGDVTRDQLRGEIAEVIFSLDAGVVSQVVRSRAGCQLFLVIQVQPAFEPALETVGGRIGERLTELKSGEALAQRVRDELQARGVEMPTWTPAASTEAIDRQRVLFELDGDTVTVGDMLAHTGGQLPPAAALVQLVGEVVFSQALERQRPEVAAAVEAEALAAFAAQFQAHRLLQAQIDAVDEETLRAFFEERRDRFQSDPQVELELYSWPILRGDPLRSLERPRAFARRLRAGEAPAEVWQDFAEDRGAVQGSVPLTGLRTLLSQRPAITPQLVGEFSEGAVRGPYRSGNRLEVLRVATLIPARPLSFLEAQAAVRTDYASAEASALEEAWRAKLREEHDLQLFETNLAAFGTRLVDRLRGSVPANNLSTSTVPASTPDDPPPSDEPPSDQP